MVVLNEHRNISATAALRQDSTQAVLKSRKRTCPSHLEAWLYQPRLPPQRRTVPNLVLARDRELDLIPASAPVPPDHFKLKWAYPRIAFADTSSKTSPQYQGLLTRYTIEAHERSGVINVADRVTVNLGLQVARESTPAFPVPSQQTGSLFLPRRDNVNSSLIRSFACVLSTSMVW